MSREYAERRIREALKLTNGNATKARQQIIAWTYDDSKLLHALTMPHMTGIVAHAIGRVLSMGEEAEIPPIPDVKSVNASDADSKAFGMEILKAIALGHPTQFGQESASVPIKKQAASQQHIDAIKQMVSKSKGVSKK